MKANHQNDDNMPHIFRPCFAQNLESFKNILEIQQLGRILPLLYDVIVIVLDLHKHSGNGKDKAGTSDTKATIIAKTCIYIAIHEAPNSFRELAGPIHIRDPHCS